jgi:oligoribonuclease
MATPIDAIVWIDFEMTGLDLTKDAVVEVACLITDSELNELDEGLSLVVTTDESKLASMAEIVREMHKASGLLDQIADGVSLSEAQTALGEYVKARVPEARKAPLAGSSVYVDRMFLARDFPEVDAHLHYRLIDVSSVKELARRWYPKTFFAAPEKYGNHRALADIRESIAELRYYREAILVPGPGLSSQAAKAIADKHVRPL